MYIETERTPNPATLKFLPGRTISESGGIDFASPEAAAVSPLATALFSLGDVEGVFVGRDFISVTKAEGAGDWTALKPQVLGIVADHFASGAPLMVVDTPEDALNDDPADADIVLQIRELIDTRVRPAVAADGGDIVYRGFDKGVVLLKLHGACAGCPSSTATLKNGIENLLKHYVPEVIEVRAI